MKKILITLFLVFTISATQKPIPRYIQTCSRSDPRLNECFANNANLAIKHIAKGDPEYNIKSLLPFKWRDVLVLKAPGLIVNLLDVTAYGVENMTVVEPSINLDKNIIRFDLHNPLMIWKADYNATVEENGESKTKNGHVELHYRDDKYGMAFKYNLQNRNGIEYAKIIQADEAVLAANIEIKADASDTNGLLEKHWEHLKNNLITEENLDTCAGTIAEFISKIFDVVPFNEIFTE